MKPNQIDDAIKTTLSISALAADTGHILRRCSQAGEVPAELGTQLSDLLGRLGGSIILLMDLATPPPDPLADGSNAAIAVETNLPSGSPSLPDASFSVPIAQGEDNLQKPGDAPGDTEIAPGASGPTHLTKRQRRELAAAEAAKA